MDRQVAEILEQMTLEEKASLCSGLDFWNMKGIARLGLPSIMLTDGPHGVRKQDMEAEKIGLGNSIEATCFPTASMTASSWDPYLIEGMGEALGKECKQEDVAVLLGPGVNMKRSPLCGRNFEYFSEDPFLAGTIGVGLVKGIQKMGVGTSVKHFAANNQEYRRFITDSEVDERTLREIYLTAFEMIVREAQPWTLMCGYNQLNGTYCSDNKWLLTDVLRDEWGFEGVVMSDWGAVHNRVEGIKAGLDLEMPGSGGINDRKIIEAVESGELGMDDLDKVVARLIDLILKAKERESFAYDKAEHHELARHIAAQSAVLLKNEGILPLSKGLRVAVVGEFAERPRYQGAGSSQICPTKLSSLLDGLEEKGIEYTYYQGYDETDNTSNEWLLKEAVKGVREADCIIVVAGLPDAYESEGYDRESMEMPTYHRALIEAMADSEKPVVVVLQNGSPVAMPWADDVEAILECFLSGQAGGLATADLLYGDVNPSGKMAESIPYSVSDNLSSSWFAKDPYVVEYREGLYMGYRYYDKANKNVRYPFGYGLSYTTFSYDSIRCTYESISVEELKQSPMDVSIVVKNTGDIAGYEVVQLYVKAPQDKIHRPIKELKGFDKVWLEPGQRKEIIINLNARSFAYYDVKRGQWKVEPGEYKLCIGGSSRDLPLVHVLEIKGEVTASDREHIDQDRAQAPEYYLSGEGFHHVSRASFEAVIDKDIEAIRESMKEWSLNTAIGDFKNIEAGHEIYTTLVERYRKSMSLEDNDDPKSERMMEAMLNDMPLRSLIMFSRGEYLTVDEAESMLETMKNTIETHEES